MPRRLNGRGDGQAADGPDEVAELETGQRRGRMLPGRRRRSVFADNADRAAAFEEHRDTLLRHLDAGRPCWALEHLESDPAVVELARAARLRREERNRRVADHLLAADGIVAEPPRQPGYYDCGP